MISIWSEFFNDNPLRISNYLSRNLNDTSRELLVLETSLKSSGKESENNDPYQTLNSIRVSNVDRLIVGQLNINSLKNKLEGLKLIVKGNIDILIITESKLDDTFPINQFIIQGFAPPFRADRNKNGGGVIIYVREDIPSREMTVHPTAINFEGIFFEINLKKSKWLLFGGYNPHKDNISNFLNQLGPILDYYMPKYDNFLLLGDFNSEMSEDAISVILIV